LYGRCRSSRPPALRPKRLDTADAGNDHLANGAAHEGSVMIGLRNIQVERLSLKVRRVPGLVAILAVCIVPAFVAWAQEAGDARSTASGVYTDDQANRGQAVFARKCQECHGETLEGAGMAPGLRGSEFLSGWQGKPLRRIYSRILSTMPPDDVGTLTESETLDLVALVLRANGYPAGSRALARADELDSIAVAPPEGKR
jgi:mono/diheme cytochrome c family protein